MRQPHDLERPARPARAGGCRDAIGHAERRHHLGHARHDLQVAFEGIEQAVAILLLEFLGQVEAEFLADLPHHRRVAAAEEMPRDIVEIDADLQPRQLVHEHLRADDLAVDQHAVAVEDDEFRGHRSPRAHYTPGSWRGKRIGRSGRAGGFHRTRRPRDQSFRSGAPGSRPWRTNSQSA